MAVMRRVDHVICGEHWATSLVVDLSMSSSYADETMMSGDRAVIDYNNDKMS